MQVFQKKMHFGTTFLFETNCVFLDNKNVLYFLKNGMEKTIYICFTKKQNIKLPYGGVRDLKK